MTDQQINHVYDYLKRIDGKLDAINDRQHEHEKHTELRLQALENAEKTRPPFPPRPCPDFVDHVKRHQKNEESVRVQAEVAQVAKQRMRDRVALVASRVLPYAIPALIGAAVSKF